ncbi:YbaK/EbsC family protein [Aliamphritea hakodatensis]|uniref:YbaK/EbsC family protein n=1 Tax=Aliamphritea hakodatensis TaxID=2895352 RepID=UPI0022FD9E78|nr:YbaK/EbsC family protein [Aliamphritea hakodatensis]
MNNSTDLKTHKVLDSLGIDCEIIKCKSELSDTKVFCEHYGYSVNESANLLLVASKKGEKKYAACLVLATTRLDVNKAARKKLGVSRISFASPDQTRELTGMELGGVTPFGLPESIPVWIDSRVMQCEQVIIGGGNRESKIIMAPEMLMKIPNMEIVEDLAF